MDTLDRLRLYVRLFSQRPDVHVWEETWHVPSGAPELPHGCEWLAQHNLRFVWGFKPGKQGDHPSSAGGVLDLSLGHTRGWESQTQRHFDGVDSSLMFDMLVDEGTSHFIVHTGNSRANAVPAFYNANDETLRPFESLEHYLTLGARRAFAWYWASVDERETLRVLERLHRRSVPAGTERDGLIEGLTRAGANQDEAREIVAWLGEDARVLVAAGAP